MKNFQTYYCNHGALFGGSYFSHTHEMEEGGETKKKKLIRRNLPINVKYKIIDTYYTGGIFDNPHTCDNCGKLIANVAKIEDENAKKFEVGMDCAKTLSGIGNTIEFSLAENNFKEADALRRKFNKLQKDKGGILSASNSPSGAVSVAVRNQRGDRLSEEYINKEFFFRYLPELKEKITNPEKNDFHAPYEDSYDFGINLGEYFKQPTTSAEKKEEKLRVDNYDIHIIDTRRESKKPTGESWYFHNIEIKIYVQSGDLLAERTTLMPHDITHRIIWALNEIEFEKFEGNGMKHGGEAGFGNSEKKTNFVSITKTDIQNVISGKSKVSNGKIIQTTASYLKTNAGTGSLAKDSKLYKKQEAETLKSYITRNNLWVSDIDLTNYVTAGVEQKVYRIDEKSVLKINDSIFYNSWEDYLNSLLLHNYFFPDTSYELIGFAERNDVLCAVVRQQYIKATKKTKLDSVKKMMAENGFINTKNNDYRHPVAGIILEDLHEENVLTADGILYFVDTVFYLK